MSLRAIGTGARAWIVPRQSFLDSVMAAGLPLRAAEAVTRANRQGLAHPEGDFVVIESDSDPRRRPWGLLGFSPLPDARELDAEPERGLFDEPSLFTGAGL